MLKRWFFITLLIFLVGCVRTTVPEPEKEVLDLAKITSEPSPVIEYTTVPEPIVTSEEIFHDDIGSEAVPGSQPFDLNSFDQPDFQGDSLPVTRGDFTATSGACGICHTGLLDGSGQDISIDTSWRSTMMANAARDPYWLATVRAETLIFPTIADVLEDKCATCHMPLARFEADTASKPTIMFEEGFVSSGHEDHKFAFDGVSCTLCHQILPDNFGFPESFSGEYLIDTETPIGERITFGPFPVGMQQANIMQTTSGFIPVKSSHIQEAALCATCHTLYTPYIDNNGQIVGEFPEQTIYLEWLNSDYADQMACQSCHMPVAQGQVRISNVGGPPRSPFHQHYFVGGNAYMMQIFMKYWDELIVTASGEQFTNTLSRIIDQIGSRTGKISIDDIQLSDSKLSVNIIVESQVGHKFPSGFPSRRAWLHIMVIDDSDQVIFESGGFDQSGKILTNQNDVDSTLYEPHYEVIEDSTEVQIYEAILKDVDGNVTTTLLRGSGYIKDNRLLPMGFDINNSDEDIAVYGRAAQDRDFVSGSDQVRYLVALDGVKGPITVIAELLYQSIGYRWAENLVDSDAIEPQRFRDYYLSIPNLPILVGKVVKEVSP